MNQVRDAVQAIAEGKLIGLPTETVYGLAAPMSSSELVKKIFSLKERPFYDPLILHVSDSSMAKRYVKDWPAEAKLLTDLFWPGPLTLILEKDDQVSDLITAGLSSVGVRCPDSQLALELINVVDDALAAPSANKFTKTSPSSAMHVRETFDANDVFVLDGGNCKVGIESTIVSLLKLKSEGLIEVLRPGMITVDAIKEAVSPKLEVRVGKNAFEENAARLSPGLEKIHYSPSFPCGVIENSSINNLTRSDFQIVELDRDPVVTAREVYSLLRSSLPEGFTGRYFVIPRRSSMTKVELGQWGSILDRLLKASTLPCFI